MLWLKVKTGGMNQEQARRVIAEASRRYAPLERFVPMEDAFHAAMEFSVSGYDGSFLALARNMGAKLVTEDGKLRKAAGVLACSIEEFLSEG